MKIHLTNMWADILDLLRLYLLHICFKKVNLLVSRNVQFVSAQTDIRLNYCYLVIPK